MVHIIGGVIIPGPLPPPPPTTLESLARVLYRRPRLYALLAVLLALAVSHALSHQAAAALLHPTLAHSRPLNAASDAAIARDVLFAHTYSRAKPPSRAVSWGSLLSQWRARLAALAVKGEDTEQALGQQHAGRLTGEAVQWAAFGETLGDDWSARHAGFTRCAQASFAVETYFCGSAASTALRTGLRPYLYQPGVAALAVTVQRAAAAGASLIAEVTLTDDADKFFGHHFALRVAPQEGVKLYMSFIGEYTLGAYLARHPLPLHAAQWQEALAHLHTLEAASGNWSAQAVDAYRALFDVDLGDRRPHAKKAAGAISIAHAAVCVVPPWSGTRADPAAAGHAERVAQLLPRPLQAFSLFASGAAGGALAAEEQGGEQEAGVPEEYF